MKTIETKKIVAVFVLGAALLAIGFLGWQKAKNSRIAPELNENAEEVLGEEKISDTVKKYQDSELGFSFDYPDNFTSQKFAEDSDTMIVVEGADGKNGFQAVVAPYEEEEELSLDLIKDFAQDLEIKDEKEISLGAKGEVEAFSFTLQDPNENEEDLGTFKEVWFVRNGQLYQISSDVGFSSHMEKILDSFRFN